MECQLGTDITATVFSSVQLQRKASIKSDTDLHFGAFGVRASYKGPDTKSAEVSGEVSALDLNDLLIKLSPYKNYELFHCEMGW